MSVLDVVIAIVALCVVIILHELGHYLAAVRAGMKVDRFSVFGIGPAIVKLGTWRGTEFVIGAIPFGAYVLIRGMEPDELEREPEPETTANFRDKPLRWRGLVLAGGPLANYITAIVLFFAIFAIAGLPGDVRAIRITEVGNQSPAAAAGILPGDELLAIAASPIDPAKRGLDVATLAEAHRGTEIEVAIEREGVRQSVALAVPAEGSALGIKMLADPGPRSEIGIGAALVRGVSEPFVQSARILRSLYMLATGQLKASLSGPVEIVHQIAQASDRGWVPFVEMTALISTLLGLFNLLPLPALDGGRLAFLGYEFVARKRANPRVEEFVHGYGMLALLALMLFVTVGDVQRLWTS